MSDVDLDEISYAVSFPLPYRVLSLVGLGILGWATNLHGIDILGIDVVSTLALDTRSSTGDVFSKHTRTASDIYKTVYKIAALYASWCFVSWITFRSAAGSDVSLVDVFGYVPAVSALLVLLVLVCPFDILYKSERDKFLSVGGRLVVSPDAIPGEFHAPTTDYSWTTTMGYAYYHECIKEWSASDEDNRKPLYNALKYATAFPLIYLSAAQIIVESDLVNEKGDDVANSAWHGEHPLFRLWLLSAAVNSLYSFWWDVTNDWGLELLKFESSKSSERPLPRRLVLPRLHSGVPLLNNGDDESEAVRVPQYCGLRTPLLYPLPVYPFLIFVNFFLRMAWSVKLSSHLHSTDGSVTIFLLEVAEIIRRWMWVFVRVEWEYIKRAREKSGRNRPANVDGAEPDYELNPPTPNREEDFDD
ncbi:hypothetical protein D9758_001936 [Tetrapyrgos nigripes]|uniref:EXS domain-containing protein n=1 Tax=Tetrapyrgos nigripes TaxID=182062 RepID=A0A8H5GT87_9AGAR|nr:hypothetical protein D9758_001936 [Tetrapyrgos nigripes]